MYNSTSNFGESVNSRTVNKNDYVKNSDAFKIIDEIKHDAENKHKRARIFYDKDGVIIEEGDILFTPDDKFFRAVISVSGETLIAESIDDKFYPKDPYTHFDEQNIFDALLHRRWTPQEKENYKKCSDSSVSMILMFILSVVSLLVWMYLDLTFNVFGSDISLGFITLTLCIVSFIRDARAFKKYKKLLREKNKKEKVTISRVRKIQ